MEVTMTERQIQKTKQERGFTNAYAMPTVRTNEDDPSLIPATVLPEQFYGPLRGAAYVSGELALMRAVLDDAIDCYQKRFTGSGRRIDRVAREAETWLFSNDERWPFAFVNVCAALGIEPEYLRRGLRQRHRQRPAYVRQKRRRPEAARAPSRIAA
jgi:hypothetical protein